MSGGRAPRQHHLATSGGDLCWFEWGARQEVQPSLVLSHATGFHARLWDQVVAALPDDLHIIAVDHRGHGRSYRPEDISHWSLAAADLVTLIEAAGVTRAFLAGHSMGATCVGFATARLPEIVSGALLIDPVIFPEADYIAAGGEAQGDWTQHPVARRRNEWSAPEDMIARFASRSPYDSWEAAVLADYCNWGLVPAANGEGLELACPPVLEASAYAGALRDNPHPEISTIKAPVTILRGRNGERAGPVDFSVSPTWPDLYTAIPGARDLQWSEHSHFIPMEDPNRVAMLIRELMAG